MSDRKEQHFSCKSSWPDGPWKNEPDQVDWVDEATGYNCRIFRNPAGAFWLGYVYIPKHHPLFGMDYDHKELSKLRVHGGVTWSFPNSFPNDYDDEERPEEWEIGFDCSHAWDLMPTVREHMKHTKNGRSYKDQAFVTAEVESLAKQLKELEGK